AHPGPAGAHREQRAGDVDRHEGPRQPRPSAVGSQPPGRVPGAGRCPAGATAAEFPADGFNGPLGYISADVTPSTIGDLIAQDNAHNSDYQQLANVVILVSLPIAGCTLAASRPGSPTASGRSACCGSPAPGSPRCAGSSRRAWRTTSSPRAGSWCPSASSRPPPRCLSASPDRKSRETNSRPSLGPANAAAT